MLGSVETLKFDYLALPQFSGTDAITVENWVANQRSNGKMIKAVLPNDAADKEYIINFTTSNIVVGEEEYTAAEYCSRIAGLIAGTPLTQSTTYKVLPEVDSVRSYTKAQLDTAIGNGEFVIFHDGEKVKVARGVNSLKTLTPDKGASFKKIKVVDILDMYYSDITKTISDNYIGRFPNKYDNKALLLTAIDAYHDQLEQDQLFDVGVNSVEIDIEAQRAYLKSQGVDADNMSDEDVKFANTDDKVFIKSNIKPLDAMEDIEMKAYL